MQVLDIHNAPQLQTANGWRGKQQCGQAVKTQQRDEGGGLTAKPGGPGCPPLGNRGLLRGMIKDPYLHRINQYPWGCGCRGWGLISSSIF